MSWNIRRYLSDVHFGGNAEKDKTIILDKTTEISNTIKGNTFYKEAKIMKVTVKGQVSIPHHIREKLGITPNTDVNFQEEGGRLYLIKKEKVTDVPGFSLVIIRLWNHLN